MGRKTELATDDAVSSAWECWDLEPIESDCEFHFLYVYSGGLRHSELRVCVQQEARAQRVRLYGQEIDLLGTSWKRCLWFRFQCRASAVDTGGLCGAAGPRGQHLQPGSGPLAYLRWSSAPSISPVCFRLSLAGRERIGLRLRMLTFWFLRLWRFVP